MRACRLRSFLPCLSLEILPRAGSRFTTGSQPMAGLLMLPKADTGAAIPEILEKREAR
jgi:hypothetical protein